MRPPVGTGLRTAAWDTITLSDIQHTRKINEGAQGSIYEATIRGHGDTTFAIKYIKCSTAAEFDNQYRMAKKLQSLQHTHLIRYYAALQDRAKMVVLIVMEFYKEENLGFLIRHTGRMNEHTILSLGLQCATALTYLHTQSPPIAHCDVKPENMLMFDAQTRVVLTDLESIQEMPCAADSSKEGTFAWCAPEFLNKKDPITVQCDIWSLGVVLFVLARLPEYPALEVGGEQRLLNDSVWKSGQILAQALSQSLRPLGYSTAFITLVAAMLQHNPAKRPESTIKLQELITDIMTANLLGETI